MLLWWYEMINLLYRLIWDEEELDDITFINVNEILLRDHFQMQFSHL